MNDNGYVYVLMNPSMKGLVKIGKSTRTPQQRADELSSTTGVPTPFVVVYDYYFESCTKAEQYIHTYLEEKGFRVSGKREFFEIPVKDAVDAVMEAKNHFGEFIKNEDNEIEIEIPTSEVLDSFLDSLDGLERTEKNGDPGKIMLLMGLNHFLGLDGELQDYEEALIYFEKALKLGESDAYLKIGSMYKYGQGVKENESQAFKYFKEGAKNGSIDCYGEIARIMEKQENIENTKKSWKRYFELSKSINYTYAGDYLMFIIDNKLDFNYKDKVVEFKDEILGNLKEMRDEEEEEWEYNYYDGYIKKIKKLLKSDKKKKKKKDEISKPSKKSFWDLLK